jgi:deferrochelatase/peroxidase EfeB
MGHTASKNPKINKNHNKQKMFRFGISVGRNDLNLEGHVQMGYCSTTVKNYNPAEKTQEDNIQNVEE